MCKYSVIRKVSYWCEFFFIINILQQRLLTHFYLWKNTFHPELVHHFSLPSEKNKIKQLIQNKIKNKINQLINKLINKISSQLSSKFLDMAQIPKYIPIKVTICRLVMPALFLYSFPFPPFLFSHSFVCCWATQ